MAWSRKRMVVGGFIVGFGSCVVLMAAVGSMAWQYKHRLLPRLAQAYAVDLGVHLLRALPDGYVTKNRERVITALDAFTNAVSRGQVRKAQIAQVISLLLAGMADGALSYRELDRVIEAMEAAASAGSGIVSPAVR